ncbi:hypothetical protein RKY72_00290, partial [Streptococcus pneumoniae]|nr:hypothetical protein [Streptococcus pneumoniae]
AHVEYRKVLFSRNSYKYKSDYDKKLAEAQAKIDEANKKLTAANNEFQTVRAVVVPEPNALAETKKKAEEAKAEEVVAKKKSDEAAQEVEVAKKEVEAK